MSVVKKYLSYKAVRISGIFILVVGLCVGGYFAYNNIAKSKSQNNSKEQTVKVARGDIDVAISGTGTVQPISRYDIVPLVKGNILQAPFEEGMDVKLGDLLYKIDDSDLSFNIQKAENGIEKLKINTQSTVESIKDLNVYAPIDGRISGLSAKEGDQTGSNSKIAEIIEDRHIVATIPFIKTDVDKIKVGQKATVSAVSEWASCEGTVKHINNTGNYQENGSLTFNVEIEMENPGTFNIEAGTTNISKIEGNTVTTGTTQTVVTEVKGTVHSLNGDVTSFYSGKLSYSDNRIIAAQTPGKIKKVYVKNNEWVHRGQKILELENDSLSDTIQKGSLDIKDSQLSLEAQKKLLKDYNILSPINGKVIKKNFKAGDTINNGNNSTVLMTVADLTKMVFTIDVDELDIAKVSNGQKVAITADALPGTNFDGEVTSTSVEGKTQNGVTTYPVQVTIASPGKLKPGMNVNAKILVESKKGILYLPVSAVTKMGNKSFVFVKGSGNANKDAAKQASAKPEAAPAGDNQQRAQGKPAEAGQNSTQRQNRQWSQNGVTVGANMGDRQRKEVVVGINNDNVIEIVSGLNEGETVYLPQLAATMNPGNPQGGPNVMRIPAGGGGFSGGAARPAGGNQGR